VRKKLLDLQRDLAAREDVLMDGRDIGTAILPNADLKIFLTASSGERARRRYLELKEKGETASLSEIQKEIEERDYRDTHRETSPLRQAEDAVLLDSSDLNLEEVVERIVSLAKERMQ
jgi:cytidylate kinase